jgi:hypothetical protein
MSTRDMLPLWVFASACKHFTDTITGIHVYVEGQERDMSGISDWCEIRIDGPWICDVSKGVCVVTCEINILVSTVIDSTNLYRESVNHTKIIPAFDNFCVYKYGPDSDDENDASLVGTMILQPVHNVNDRVEIARFGQIHPSVQLLQSTIEGHYSMTLFV